MSEPEARQLSEIQAAADQELARAPERPDVRTLLEEQTVELERVRTKRANAQVKSLRQDIKERKKYAGRIFNLIVGWVSAVLLLLFVQGWSVWGFNLGQGVVLAAIGSTTINVLGLFYIVAHYLFPTRNTRERLQEQKAKAKQLRAGVKKSTAR